MSVLERLFYKIKYSLDSSVADSTIARIVDECNYRTDWLNMDISDLLNQNVHVSINERTGEIDIRQNELFGIFWSFDAKTGDLVGT